jgi:hypothetical protein
MVTSTLSITQKNKMSLHLNQLHQMVMASLLFLDRLNSPTLIDLEKCEKSYPEIHADIIHEVAVKTRSVPLEVAPIELLKSRKENTRHIVGSSQASEDQEVVHFHSHEAVMCQNTIQII